MSKKKHEPAVEAPFVDPGPPGMQPPPADELAEMPFPSDATVEALAVFAPPPPDEEMPDEDLLPAVAQLLSEDPLAAAQAGLVVNTVAPPDEETGTTLYSSTTEFPEVASLELPPVPPDFKATHEVVGPDGTVEPLIHEGDGFRTVDGDVVTRAHVDRFGALRRILPR